MARRRTFNPGEVRKINSDIADVIHSSGNAIGKVYDEMHGQVRLLNKAEARADALKDDGKIVPRSLRGEIKDIKDKIRKLDERTSRYGTTNKKRLEDRLEVVKTSPGASASMDAIRAVERDLFHLGKKMKQIGSDVRGEVRTISAKIKGLEERAGGFLGYRSKVRTEKSPTELRREKEAKVIAAISKRWEGVRPRMAKRDQMLMKPGTAVAHSQKGAGRVLEMRDDGRVKVEFKDKDDRPLIYNMPPKSLASEDMAHIDRQLRAIVARFDRGQSVGRDLDRLVDMVNDYAELTKKRKGLPGYSDAKRVMREFEKGIDNYVVAGVTKPGLDKLMYKLEQLGRQFSSEAKAQWRKVDQREYATLMRRLRKQLTQLTPGKRKRKKNPSVREMEAEGAAISEAFEQCIVDRKIPKTKAAIDRKIAACNRTLADLRESQKGWTKSREYAMSEQIEEHVADIHEFMRELHRAKRKVNPSKTRRRANKNPFHEFGSAEQKRIDPYNSYRDGVITSPDEVISGKDSSGIPVLAVRVGDRWANVHKLFDGNYGVRWWMRARDLKELGIKAKNPKKNPWRTPPKNPKYIFVTNLGNVEVPLQAKTKSAALKEALEIYGMRGSRTGEWDDPRGKQGRVIDLGGRVIISSDEIRKKGTLYGQKKNPKKNPYHARGSARAKKLDPRNSYEFGVIDDPDEIVEGKIKSPDGFGIHVLAVRVGKRWADAHPLGGGAYGVRFWMDPSELKELGVKTDNPKKATKKATKKVAKKATKKATPKYQLLINRCQKLWGVYCEKQTKKSLREVLAHLDTMKESTSESVKKERARCLRAANKEAKRLKVK